MLVAKAEVKTKKGASQEKENGGQSEPLLQRAVADVLAATLGISNEEVTTQRREKSGEMPQRRKPQEQHSGQKFVSLVGATVGACGSRMVDCCASFWRGRENDGLTRPLTANDRGYGTQRGNTRKSQEPATQPHDDSMQVIGTNSL